ncbi:hypothetical protein AABB24_015631 [Solanum stoloniferum]|uniref:Uncharacterized protein n=1 Tax=Solanum stoloniferum TaxID=62892 RepID=A0ABD2TQH7_9SOLN
MPLYSILPRNHVPPPKKNVFSISLNIFPFPEKTNAPGSSPSPLPRDPHPLSETALSHRKNVNSGGSLPHLSLTLFNQSVKVRFSKIFLLLHNLFVVSSKIGVSKNSNFEFLKPKSPIKGGLRSSFRDHRKNGERDP